MSEIALREDPVFLISWAIVGSLFFLSLGFYLGSLNRETCHIPSSYIKQDLNGMEVVQYPGNPIDPSVLDRVHHWQLAPFGNILPLIQGFVSSVFYSFVLPVLLGFVFFMFKFT